MTRTLLSPAAHQLLQALVDHIGLDAPRILIGRFRSVDWQSLTFIGERHEIGLRLSGPEAAQAVARLRDELVDARWRLAGHVVADIVIVGQEQASDGSILLELEALTLAD